MLQTDINKIINSAGLEAQYDEHAKRLLGHKEILSHILVNTVPEFKGMNPKTAEKYIEGEPCIGRVPHEPGLTNAEITKSVTQGNGSRSKKITGFNTENSESHEGLVRFDIVFYVRMPDGLSQIIINIEAQKSEPHGYSVFNRGIYYSCRLISSQKGRDFIKSDYNSIKSVYSVWICMNMEECIFNHIHLTDDALLGEHHWKGNISLLNVILIGLPKELPEKGKRYELHRLLTGLFSEKLTYDEKKHILEEEYNIEMEEDIGEEMRIMCNLSQGVKEAGIAIGMEQGLKQGMKTGIAQGMKTGISKGKAEIILNMYAEKLPIDFIAKVSNMNEKEIMAIIGAN